jgi:choline oxidase
VVGGGTAGNVVAARLSEDPSVTVCVLEAGPSDVGDDDVLKLERWMGLLESGYDWDYPVEPQASGNSFMRHARAKVLGGCSSHNSCIAFWAPAEDLDDWAAAGCTGWSAADLFPLYRRLENNDAPGDHHGRTGPVKLRHAEGRGPVRHRPVGGVRPGGHPDHPFNTGKTVVRGANWFQINSDENNIRQSSSVAYLHPILASVRTWTYGRGCGPRSSCWTGGAAWAPSTWTRT